MTLRILIHFAMDEYRHPDGEPLIAHNPVCALKHHWAPIVGRTERYIDKRKVGEVWNKLQEARLDLCSRDALAGIDLTIFLLLAGARRDEAAALTWQQAEIRALLAPTMQEQMAIDAALARPEFEHLQRVAPVVNATLAGMGHCPVPVVTPDAEPAPPPAPEPLPVRPGAPDLPFDIARASDCNNHNGGHPGLAEASGQAGEGGHVDTIAHRALAWLVDAWVEQDVLPGVESGALDPDDMVELVAALPAWETEGAWNAR